MSITSQGQQATESLNGKLTFEQDKNRIVGRDEDNLIRMLILADGQQFNMKISQPGHDVLTATDDQLIFNSDQNVFKIVGTPLTASFSVTSGTTTQGSATVTLNHNLGYVPLTESTVQITADWNGKPGIFPVPYFVPAMNSTVGAFIIASYVRVSNVTATQIKFEVGILPGVSTISGTITVYIKQESAT